MSASDVSFTTPSDSQTFNLQQEICLLCYPVISQSTTHNHLTATITQKQDKKGKQKA